MTAAEAEYSRVLDLRERLRVEEITIEMKGDMERLYLLSPFYYAHQLHLGDVRILIMRTCQSLSYIEEECASHGLDLDVSAIDEQRMLNRPATHPFNIISPYLSLSTLEEFHNYDFFTPSIYVNPRDTPRNHISDSRGANREEVMVVVGQKGTYDRGGAEDEEVDDEDQTEEEDQTEDEDEDADEDDINVDEDDDSDEHDIEADGDGDGDYNNEERDDEMERRRLGKTMETVAVEKGSSSSDESLLSSHYSLFLPNYNHYHEGKQNHQAPYDTPNDKWPGRPWETHQSVLGSEVPWPIDGLTHRPAIIVRLFCVI